MLTGRRIGRIADRQGIGSLSYHRRGSFGMMSTGGLRMLWCEHRRRFAVRQVALRESGQTRMTNRREQIPAPLPWTAPAFSVVVRRGPSAPADGAPTRRYGSDQLCASAIHVYEGAFRQVPEFDPDMGLSESYACGRQVLITRQRASAWEVPGAMAAAAEQLFERVRSLRADDLIAAIDEFPRGFLEVVDRRTACAPDARRPRRRWSDRQFERVPLLRPSIDAH
jgi:hypothetical protein